MAALLPDLAFLSKFDSVDEERLHRKQRLAASFRLFGTFGFDEGVAGHITVRDPEHLDRFWVNPFGMNFKHIRVSDLICVDHTGEAFFRPRQRRFCRDAGRCIPPRRADCFPRRDARLSTSFPSWILLRVVR